MRKPLQLLSLTAALFLPLTLTSCGDEDPVDAVEDSMEDAGDAVDDAVDDTVDAVDDAVDDLSDG